METHQSLELNRDGSSSASGHGALIVKGGPRHGARQFLNEHFLLIGRDPACDVRLNDEKIEPMHCVLVTTFEGVILRDLKTRLGTRVNDQTTSECLLRNGDLIAVAAFQFQLEWSAPAESALPPPIANKEEIAALRVQAAAVAAEQAQLFEQEKTLHRKQQAIDKQQEQLANHLEQRNRQITQKQEQLLAERARFREERQARDVELEAAREELHKAERAAQELKERSVEERERFKDLQKRLRVQWDQQWSDQEKFLTEREKAVVRLERAARKETESLARERLSFTGETELKRREIDAGWAEMKQAQKEWLARRAREGAEHAAERDALRKQIREFQRAQRIWADQCRQAEWVRERLETEAKGLDARIQNLRHELEAQQDHYRGPRHEVGNEWDAAQPGTAAPAGDEHAEQAPEKQALPLDVEDLLGQLERVAGDLNDQRLHLLEQWRQFAQLQDAWQQEHRPMLPTLEEIAEQLKDREAAIERHEEALAQKQTELAEQRRLADQRRAALEARVSQVQLREIDRQRSEKELSHDVQALEAIIQREKAELSELQQRWRANRRTEVAQLRKDLKRYRKMHQQCTEAWQEYQRRMKELGERERKLAERELALEQFRFEAVSHSESAASADKRIRKLERHWAVLHGAETRRITTALEDLDAKTASLQSLAADVHNRSDQMIAEDAELKRERTDWEHRRLLIDQARQRQEAEVAQLRGALNDAKSHAEDVRRELERLMNHLLEQSGEETPLLRAA